MISKIAHDSLVKKGLCPVKKVYEPGVGYVEKHICPIKHMRKEMSNLMKSFGDNNQKTDVKIDESEV